MGGLLDKFINGVVNSAIKISGIDQLSSQTGSEEERIIEINKGDRIRLENISGEISIKAVPGRNAKLQFRKTCWGRNPEEAAKALEALEVKIDRSGKEVVIRAVYPNGHFPGLLRRGPSVDYKLDVPEDIEISANSTSGNIAVSGVKADVSSTTVSGSIAAMSCGKRIKLSSTSGEIKAIDCAGSFDMHTVSGGIVIRGSKLSGAGLNSVSGSIDLQVELEPKSNVFAKSVSGSIRLNLPADSRARIESKTVSGGTSFNQPVSFEVKETQPANKHFVVVLNQPDSSIRMETVSGSMSVG